jgi:hypothetical protein
MEQLRFRLPRKETRTTAGQQNKDHSHSRSRLQRHDESHMGTTSRCTHRKKIEAYPDAQYRSRPGRSALDAATVKILSLETSKISFNVILLADNDAYDRIISPISSIACQSTGMPAEAEQIHTSVLLNTKYRLKTSYGITTNHYAGNNTNPLQGQGQGSGNSPACWNAVSSPMWKALEKLSPLRFTTTTPDQATTTSTQGVAFTQ